MTLSPPVLTGIEESFHTPCCVSAMWEDVLRSLPAPDNSCRVGTSPGATNATTQIYSVTATSGYQRAGLFCCGADELSCISAIQRLHTFAVSPMVAARYTSLAMQRTDMRRRMKIPYCCPKETRFHVHTPAVGRVSRSEVVANQRAHLCVRRQRVPARPA